MYGEPLAGIIADAQRGKPEALTALVDLYGARIFGFFYRLFGRREDAEDLMQEVFVRVVRTIAAYRDDGRFEAWLFRIAANLARDRIRRSRRAPTQLSLDGGAVEPDPLLETPAEEQSPARPLEELEQSQRLQRALSRLPIAEREAVLLRHFSQLSFKEVAEVMGSPLGTALARVHRGLARLRRLMGEESHGEEQVGDAAVPDDTVLQ